MKPAPSRQPSAPRFAPRSYRQQASILAGDAILSGTLDLPTDAPGVVIFVHGSGSNRNSPRNEYVAQALDKAGLGTLVFDLLTLEEQALDAVTHELRFDIPLLAERLGDVVRWVAGHPDTRNLAIGLFGSSTGAAVALVAAARAPRHVAAIVSRGGRPDLAGAELQRVQAPTLLIVGGCDEDVVAINESALKPLHGRGELHLVPGATHLFEETGALEQVAALSAAWFSRHLGGEPTPTEGNLA